MAPTPVAQFRTTDHDGGSLGFDILRLGKTHHSRNTHTSHVTGCALRSSYAIFLTAPLHSPAVSRAAIDVTDKVNQVLEVITSRVSMVTNECVAAGAATAPVPEAKLFDPKSATNLDTSCIAPTGKSKSSPDDNSVAKSSRSDVSSRTKVLLLHASHR